MSARKPNAKRRRSPAQIPCSIRVSRGGVEIMVEAIMMSEAAAVACYLLDQLQARRREHPELDRPVSVEHFGGYTPVPVTDDETLARKQVGF